jgi:hypothetical protein
MASDALAHLIDQLDSLPSGTTQLDFMIASFGGDPMVAWRMMSLIRQRVDEVSVLVPQSAYSAATLLALGADEIVMHPNSHLGPIDMQITTFTEGGPRSFSTEDISAFLGFVRESLLITDQEHLRKLFEITCKEVGSLGVGFTARSSKLAISLADRLLGMHIKNDPSGAKKKSIMDALSGQFHSHAYPVSRDEALKIDGLPVNQARDQVLEELMWQLWLDLEDDLKERRPFSPIMELLNSSEAQKLISPVPQLELPCNAPSPSYFQAQLADVTGAVKEVEPVDFEYAVAIMQSVRLARRNVTRGKILACRLPDLNIRFNALTSFRGWETVKP